MDYLPRGYYDLPDEEPAAVPPEQLEGKMRAFRRRQQWPYEKKVGHAESMAHSFYYFITRWRRDRQNLSFEDGQYAAIVTDDADRQAHPERYCGCHVSVGGLDSLTLLAFLRHIGINVPAVSVSSLEDKSIQAIHKQLGIIRLRPGMRKTDVIKQFGFPVISKAKARKIEHLQKLDNPKQTFIHAIMTGDMGEQGHYQHSDKIKLPDKWLTLFGGLYQSHRPDIQCNVAPFKVSDRCCYHLKEKPCDDWAAENHSYPFLGMMASEGGQRELGLTKNGCNYYGKTSIRSAPFAIFHRQDLLQLALDLNVEVPAIYGEIRRAPNGALYTTEAQRTGCSMCGFGIHFEKRPHRFDRLYERNPKEWRFWMHDVGWGEVLDYIGVEWRQEEHHASGQLMLFPAGQPAKR